MSWKVNRPMRQNPHTYKPIFELEDGPSREINFALRDDGVYIISCCNVLKGGERVYMRSSVTMTKDVAIELAKNIIRNFRKEKEDG